MNFITTPKGSVFDLDTIEGAYGYVGEFINSKGASSDIWKCLSLLYNCSCGLEQENKLLRSRVSELEEDIHKWKESYFSIRSVSPSEIGRIISALGCEGIPFSDVISHIKELVNTVEKIERDKQ